MKPLLALLVSLLTVGAAGCGSSGTNGSATSSSASAPATTTGPPASSSATPTPALTPAPTTRSGSNAGSATKEENSSPSSMAKRYPHGDNSIQTYGHEAGEADTQAVTAVVKRYYAAVAAGDGATACSLLASALGRSIVQSFGRSPALRGKGCAGIVSLLVKSSPGAPGADLAAVTVTHVRVNGSRGFALLRSKTIPSGEITVDREHGAWKVGALIGSALP